MSGQLRILLVLLDGLGDRAFPELGGRTPLEAAPTPHLDALAARGAVGLIHPLGPGRIPSSERAHWALLGYDDHPFPGRAVLEALGGGLPVPMERVVTFAALRSVAAEPAGFRLRDWYRAAEDEECRPIMQSLSGIEVGGVSFEVGYLARGEAILRLEGDVSEAVTDTDPFFFTHHPVLRARPLDEAGDPERAARTAEALNAYLLAAHHRLEQHPINAARRRRGAPPLNFVVTKWTGRRRPVPAFLDHASLRGATVASAGLYRGLAAVLDLVALQAPEADDPADELAARIGLALAALDDGLEFVHVHTKAADEAGHRHAPTHKRDVIAALDRALAPLVARPLPADLLLVVTADHCTPSAGPLVHSGEAVPILVVGATVRADAVERFGERAAGAGHLGTFWGRDLMPVLLNLANRGQFLGGRPTAARSLGAPRRVEPLRPAAG